MGLRSDYVHLQHVDVPHSTNDQTRQVHDVYIAAPFYGLVCTAFLVCLAIDQGRSVAHAFSCRIMFDMLPLTEPLSSAWGPPIHLPLGPASCLLKKVSCKIMTSCASLGETSVSQEI